MKFAELLREIRKRTAELPEGRRSAVAIEQAARSVLTTSPQGAQSALLQRVWTAFLGLGEGDKFDAALLDQMTPELVFRLDMIASELLELGRTNEAVRALRGALIQRSTRF